MKKKVVLILILAIFSIPFYVLAFGTHYLAVNDELKECRQYYFISSDRFTIKPPAGWKFISYRKTKDLGNIGYCKMLGYTFSEEKLQTEQGLNRAFYITVIVILLIFFTPFIIIMKKRNKSKK